MEKITGILVNPTEGSANKATIERSMEGYRKALGYDNDPEFDVVYIEGRRFVIVNTLLSLCFYQALPSVFELKGEPVLYGNLFICRYDDSLDEISLTTRLLKDEISSAEYLDTLLPHLIDLTEDDIALVLSHCLTIPSDSAPEARQVSLRRVEYYRDFS